MALVLLRGARARADNIGAFALLPPFASSLPGGGSASLDTEGITLSGEGGTQLRIGGRFQENFAAAVVPRGAAPDPRDIDTRRAWFESFLTLPYDVHVGFQYDLDTAAAPIR